MAQSPSLKTILQRGGTIKGIMVAELKSPMLGAMMDASGLDFMIIDQEHGAYSPEALGAIIAGFRHGTCKPIVRIPETRRDCFLTPLELGAKGILVPHVESREQAEAAVRFCRYPPQGDRGVSLCRSHTNFARVNKNTYLSEANDEILLIVQIETKTAMDNLDEILSTPGLDMAFIGPSDLSVSCGVDSNLRHADMRALTARIIEAAQRHSVGIGVQTYDLEAAKELQQQGVRLISYDTDVNALMTSIRSRNEALSALLPASTTDGDK
ncbi:aldolase/citrate lyase family protein [uncultured Cohaesibacter sp.]|uniref:HpcH/HpaI aldolase family protein n=1 Tax=uncultured Cohaesibacter sp. TaxID=1002546 RepID=UPI0029C825CF|nr:aldolase/citrate lyase family protein [uncultured Cohaesibacter sp.]